MALLRNLGWTALSEENELYQEVVANTGRKSV